jgi:hypothetical protein
MVISTYEKIRNNLYNIQVTVSNYLVKKLYYNNKYNFTLCISYYTYCLLFIVLIVLIVYDK